MAHGCFTPLYILNQLLALSLYALFIGFCFCDGFRLHIGRKLLWFTVYATVSIVTFEAGGSFDLAFIFASSSLLAFLLCLYEKIKLKKNKL